MIKTRIKHKRDTVANWTAENPILLNGEIAIVDDGNSTKLKIGDGSTAYNSLPFYVSGADLNNATGVIPIANGGTGNTEGQAISAKKLVPISIESGTDLNNLYNINYLEGNLYYCYGDDVVKTLLNCPTGITFMMEVFPYAPYGTVIQRITSYGSSNYVWTRTYTNWNGWSDWKQFSEVNYNMPNYSAGISKSWGTLYTAETNGWIWARRETIKSNNSNRAIVEINGVQIDFHYYNNSGGSDEGAIFLPVAKGDTYKAVNTGASQTMVFYPCRG